jgi:hypothetical protein
MLKLLSFVFFMLFVAMVLPAGYKYLLHQAKFAGSNPPVEVRKRLRRAWIFFALFLVTLVIKAVQPSAGETRDGTAVPVNQSPASVTDGRTDQETGFSDPTQNSDDDDDVETAKKKGKRKRGDD